ncbi:MAG TPA: NAD(P)-binding protein [Acidimicrobiales bacterium]|jgi:phytoene dehydrogenase-like protein|nr:NAD(P)-binding protein [Acidimicrobiales bacterium]
MTRGAAGRDAVVVGSGPNRLAAAISLARAGLSVTVLEQADAPGGGTRSMALTELGFVHDVCSAVHPLALASPFFAGDPLAEFGLSWVQPDGAAAHPLPDGSAVILERSIDAMAAGLGRDGAAWRRLVAPIARRWDALAESILAPLLR